MTLMVLVLLALGFLISLVLGMAFNAMESTVLMLNRGRLRQLFADEHTGVVTEQHIFRDTKDIYFVSRLGLCATLLAAGLCLIGWVHGVSRMLIGAETSGPWIATAIAAVLFTPIYVATVFALPRVRVRRLDPEAQADIPAWMGLFVVVVRPLALITRLGRILPLGVLLPRHQLTKNDLVNLVTHLDLDDDEEDEIGEDGMARSENGQADVYEEEADEEEIIYNILDLEETRVREVMEPINSVVAIRLGGLNVDGVRELARRTGYSRFPVYRDRITDLIGFVSVYDILYTDAPDRTLQSYVSEAYFVPESMPLRRLLRDFLQRGVQVAIVVDEYGGCSGWVTREDVLEEIVGEIEDEFDARQRYLEERPDGTWLADGAIDIDDLADELSLTLDDPPYDTLAGFVLDELGEIPSEGDVVETEEAVFTVRHMAGHRVAQVHIRLRSDEDEEDTPPSSPPSG